MSQTVRAQAIRYVLVGLALNAAAYAVYLWLAWLMKSDEIAMTIIFGFGVLFSFLAHRNVTFRHRGDRIAALRRFLACYAVLYLFDFVALWFFVTQWRVPHQIVQGCLAASVAGLAFIVQKYWVFPEAAEDGQGELTVTGATA